MSSSSSSFSICRERFFPFFAADVGKISPSFVSSSTSLHMAEAIMSSSPSSKPKF